MEKEFKVFDVNNDELFIAIQSHYANLSDAKTIHKLSSNDEYNDDSLLITIAKNDYEEICSAVSLSVEDGAKFAMAILNLCQAIKY